MTVLTIALRELRERAMLLYGSAMIGVMLLITPWLSGTTSPFEVRGAGAMVMFVCFILPLAAITGGSVAASDLSDGRLGFFFSRPVSGSTIWLGKIGGAGLLVVAAATLALGPVALAGMEGGFLDTWALPAMIAAALLVVILAHAVGVMRASRSSRLAGDVAVLTIATLLSWYALAKFWLAPQLLRGTLTVLAGVAFAALLVGGAAAIVGGRSDARRAHRSLSHVVWPSLLLAGLGAAAYSRWVVAADPTDLRDIGLVRAAPRGTWMALAGEARGRVDYPVSFLFDRDSGRAVRAPGLERVAFSADGARAAWLELDPGAARGLQQTSLLTLDLTAKDARPVQTKIAFQHSAEIALDHHGHRLAAANQGKLVVYELESERLLTATAIQRPGSRFSARRQIHNLVFTAPDRVRAFGAVETPDAPGPSAIADFDLATGKWTPIVALTGEDIARPLISPDAARCYLRRGDRGTTRIDLVDAASGATLASTPLDDSVAFRLWVSGAFLADGRSLLAVQAHNHGPWRVEVRDATGALIGQHDLPFTGNSVGFGDEVEPGRLVLYNGTGPDVSTRIVDVTTFALSQPIAGLRPIGFWRRWFASAAETPQPASLGARLFLDRTGRLVELDPESLTVSAVLAGR